jgi:ABC-type branched-subunit amino acid transport system substrate-binding protein
MSRRSGWVFGAGVLLLVVLAATGGMASGAKAPPKFKNPPYKVGAVFALTGAYSGTDKDSAASLRATIAEINALGGVDGHKLEYRVVDSQSDPAKSTLAAQQIVDQYKPHVMIPDIVCIMALSALPVANRAGLVTFTGCDNGVPSNPSQYPRNFSTFPPVAVLGLPLTAAAAHVLKGRKMTVGFLHSNDAAGNGLVPVVRAAVELKGHKWAGDQPFTVGTPDLTVQLSRLRQADADVVILWGQVGDAGNVMKSVRDLAWNVQVVGGTGTTSASLVNEIPEDYRDNFHAMVTANSVRRRGSTTPPPWINTYLRRSSTTVQTLSVVGAVHDGLTYWKWAVERTKSTNPVRVTRELEKLSTLPRAQWPKGLQLTANPMYTSTQHGLRNANLNRAWGIIRPSRNIMGTYEGEVFTCYCEAPRQ